MNEEIALRVKSLPPLPKTIVEMEEIIKRPDASVGDLINVINRDPMIVANLLKAANSPLYGFREEIRSIAQAVSLFGMAQTRSIAVGISMRKLLNVDMEPYNISPDRFADVSAAQAEIIAKWYQGGKEKKELMQLAALLQEAGKIIIADIILQDNELELFKNEIATTHDIATIERSFLGDSTSAITAEIFEHWEFDDELIELIRHVDKISAAPSDIKLDVAVLNIVKTAAPMNYPLENISIDRAVKKAKKANLDYKLLEGILVSLQDENKGNFK